MKVQYFKYPVSAVMVITKACNLKCKHCFLRAGPYHSYYMSLHDFKVIVKKLVDGGVIDVSLFGGEPLIHPNIVEIMEELHGYNILWSVVTNGTMINKKMAHIIARLEPSYIVVSLDGPDKETHEFIRGPNTFERTIEGIKLLTEHGVTVVVNTIIHKRLTREKVVQLAKLAEELNFKISFIDLFPMGYSVELWKEIAPSDDEFLDLLSFILTDKRIAKVLQRNPNTSVILDPVACAAARTYLAIDEYGYTYPCIEFVGTDFKGPRLTEDSINIEDVWYSPTFKKLRNVVINQECKLVKLCPIRTSINACWPCPALAYALFGDITMPNPRCILFPRTQRFVATQLKNMMTTY